MIYLYYFLAVVLIYFSFRSFRGGLAYLNYFKQELKRPESGFTPFATVIAPCKGVDDGLALNLDAVIRQNYPAFEVIFVIDDADDPAAVVIKNVSRTSARATKLVIAPKAADSGQKVANLREAVLHADERAAVFVFVDSDVRPGPNWLRSLVGPLADAGTGAATGYRWFVRNRINLASELRAAWNALIASALGPDTDSNFCWGGSTAVRRELFEKLEVRAKWRGTLSDDFALTRMINAARLSIRFVPQAVVPSAGVCTWRELFEFTNRQMRITRVYAPKLWAMSFIGSGLFTIVAAASILMILFGRPGTFAWAAAMFTVVSVSVLSVGKAWLRFAAIRLALPDERRALGRQFPFQMTLWLFAQPLFLINSAAALWSRRIKWRGTEYVMVSAEETRVM